MCDKDLYSIKIIAIIQLFRSNLVDEKKKLKAYNICCVWLSTNRPSLFANSSDFSLNRCHFSETSRSFNIHLNFYQGKGPNCSSIISFIIAGQLDSILKVACLNLLKILWLVLARFYYSFIIVLAEFWQFQYL